MSLFSHYIHYDKETTVSETMIFEPWLSLVMGGLVSLHLQPSKYNTNLIQSYLFCIAQNHKSQICLRWLYNLYTYDIFCPRTLTSEQEKLKYLNQVLPRYCAQVLVIIKLLWKKQHPIPVCIIVDTCSHFPSKSPPHQLLCQLCVCLPYSVGVSTSVV